MTPRQATRKLMLKAHLDDLGPAPDESPINFMAPVETVTQGDWGCDGNDEVGDCAPCGLAHASMLWTANVGSIVVPSKADVVDFYSKLTGYDPSKNVTEPDGSISNDTDQGTVLMDMCVAARDSGFFGDKLIQFVHIDPNNQDHIRWGQILAGCLIIGVNLPSDADAEFENNQPWTLAPWYKFIQTVGGHCVLLGHCQRDMVKLVTWGRSQDAYWDWILDKTTEVIMPISQTWTKNGMAPSGYTLDKLQAEMQNLGKP